jgi:hypothetical protein
VDATHLLHRLATFPDALDAVLALTRPQDHDVRTSPDAWSIRDVLVHLHAEETEDFRLRLRLTLEDPAAEWPPLDPEASVRARRGSFPTVPQLLHGFREARRGSAAWLRGLAQPDWDRARAHPRLGVLRAGDLLVSWAAHDLRHLAQVARIQHALAARDAAPYSVAYAG